MSRSHECERCTHECVRHVEMPDRSVGGAGITARGNYRAMIYQRSMKAASRPDPLVRAGPLDALFAQPKSAPYNLPRGRRGRRPRTRGSALLAGKVGDIGLPTCIGRNSLLRVMAEIAAIRGLVLIMAFHAIHHRCGLFLHHNVAIRHRAMTNSALDSGLLMMHLMREIHESWKLVDPYPRNGSPFVGESLQCPDCGAVLLDRIMAAHTVRGGGKSGQISGRCDGVAAQAGQS